MVHLVPATPRASVLESRLKPLMMSKVSSAPAILIRLLYNLLDLSVAIDPGGCKGVCAVCEQRALSLSWYVRCK